MKKNKGLIIAGGIVLIGGGLWYYFTHIKKSSTSTTTTTTTAGDTIITVLNATTGQPIPNATVTLVETPSMTEFNEVTNSTGQADFGNLPFGNYTWTLNAAGYTAVSSAIMIQSAGQNFTLSMGEA